jgi:hypothetical protein
MSPHYVERAYVPGAAHRPFSAQITSRQNIAIKQKSFRCERFRFRSRANAVQTVAKIPRQRGFCQFFDMLGRIRIGQVDSGNRFADILPIASR